MNAQTVIAQLSDGQRECLRLVLGHLNSKEIGRELGISPHTVDQRLRGAMRVLNANSRFEAARKFAESEGQDPYQPLIYQSSDIENSNVSATLVGPTTEEQEATQYLTQDRSRAAITDLSGGVAAINLDDKAVSKYRLPFPRYRGEKNEMGAAHKLAWIVIIAIGSAFSFGGILSGLEALSRLAG